MKRLILALLFLLYALPAHAVVVFTDSFTSGSDANLVDYDAAHYDENTAETTGYNLYVNAANDRVQSIGGDGTVSVVRVIGTGIPTGDQKITATVYSDGTNEYTGLIVRNDSVNYYLAFFYANGGNLIELYRYDGGAFTLLTSANRTFSYPATASFEATGAGATVSLSIVIGGTAAITYNDTDAARITSGYPGLRIWTDVKTEAAWFDDLSIDDLTSAPPAGGARRKVIVLQ